MIWYEETYHACIRQRIPVARIHFQQHTDLQEAIIFESDYFGRVLTLDGAVQTTERDEFVYHELVAHFPLFAHGAVKDVLIIGGGDGGALRRTLEHPIASATLVEVDRRVIDLSREYLPSICGNAFDDPRTQLEIQDGARFVETTDRRFDLIVVDSPDPIGPAKVLFTKAFYANCKRCLRAGGVLVRQCGVPFIQAEELSEAAAALRSSFEDVAFYIGTIPTYNGGPMAFAWATDDPTIRQVRLTELTSRYEQAGITTRYYQPELFHAAFVLPNYIRELI